MCNNARSGRGRVSPTPAGTRRQGGFSLMEMLLVLSILVGAGAIVWSAAQGPMDDLRLRESAGLIRAQWDRARVKAMKTGRIQLFRYEQGGENFSLQPWQGDAQEGDPSSDLTDAASEQPAVAVDATRVGNQPLGIRGRSLPTGIVFYSGKTEEDARAAAVLQDTSGDGLQSPGNLSQPIVFYPDGTSSQARVVLTNQRFYVELQLRGLTGTARASELLAEEELTQ